MTNYSEQEEKTEDVTESEKRATEDDSFLHSAAISRFAGAELAKIQQQKSTSSALIASPTKCNNVAQGWTWTNCELSN